MPSAASIAPKPLEQNLQITEARKRLPELIDAVESSSQRWFTIGKRKNKSAMVVSYRRIEALFTERKEPKLALVIVEQLLPDAPTHLRTPAIDELSQLSSDDLLKILTIDKFPLSKKRIRELEKKLEHPEALKRLIRRFELAKAISQAQEAGVYEATEHKTGKTL